MPNERRFDDEAIAEIFRQAAEAQNATQGRLSPNEGLTLAELQEIGAEAGLSPEFIARAAERLGTEVRREEAPTMLGIPIGVARTVDLPGTLTEREWENLVVDLRSTFRAKGKIQRSGDLREWSNGNLHVMLEPSPTGHRLRMRTMKGNARDTMVAGLITALMTVGFVIAGSGTDSGNYSWLLVMLLAAVGMGVSPLLTVPGWARERGRQMEDVARRTVEMVQRRSAILADDREGQRSSADPDRAYDENPSAETVAPTREAHRPKLILDPEPPLEPGSMPPRNRDRS